MKIIFLLDITTLNETLFYKHENTFVDDTSSRVNLYLNCLLFYPFDLFLVFIYHVYRRSNNETSMCIICE